MVKCVNLRDEKWIWTFKYRKCAESLNGEGEGDWIGILYDVEYNSSDIDGN